MKKTKTNPKSEIRNPKSKCCFLLILICVVIGKLAEADEQARIIGMGGARAAMQAVDAGPFGNPAALANVVANNLSVALSVEGYRYEELPEVPPIQFAAELALNSRPSIYYSRTYGDWGFSIGHTAQLRNFATFELEDTRSEYIVNEQFFTATTSMLTDYSLLWERAWTIGVSKKLDTGVAGLRLKRVTQQSKRGTILSALRIESRHESNVNINDPRELIPAIIDGIDFADPAQYFDAEDLPTQDLTVSKFELDLGYQRDFSVSVLKDRPLKAGLVIENLLQRKLVEPLPLQIRLGVSHAPLDWLTVATDIARVSGHRGLDFALGWELYKHWSKGFRGAAALRGGLGRVDATGAFSLGISFALGDSRWEYTLRKRFRDEPFSEAIHFFASTVQF